MHRSFIIVAVKQAEHFFVKRKLFIVTSIACDKRCCCRCWNKHIDMITSKATNRLSFLKPNLSKCSSDVKSMAYNNTSLVRPELEYASAAWDPCTKTNIMKIETMQRRAAARFALKFYDSYSHQCDWSYQSTWMG